MYNNNKSNLIIIGYLLIIISIFGIILGHPFSGYNLMPIIQFCSILISNLITLTAGSFLVRDVKKSVEFAVSAIIISFVVNQTISAIISRDYGFFDFFFAAIVPGFLVFALWYNNKKIMLLKSNKAQILN